MTHTIKRKDEEVLQSYMRIFFTVLLTSSFIVFAPSYFQNKSIVYALGLYILFVGIHTDFVYKYPGVYLYRRIATITADLAIITYLMYQLNLYGILLYPLLIWVIVGNGIRFGTKYLYTALGIALVFITAAITYNTSWLQYPGSSITLVVGLIMISMLNVKSLKYLHELNITLEQKVSSRLKQLEYEYFHDTLTGLLNRYALERHLKDDTFSGLMVINIDSFRNINELYGMHTGNTLLIEIAKHLQDFFKNRNFQLYRIYGDIFAVKSTMPYIDHEEHEKTIRDLLAFIDKLNLYTEGIEGSINIDITIGLSLESKDALNKAEMALSFAKSHAKKFIAYSKMIDSSHSIPQLLQQKQEIKDAVSSDNFVPVFQPIVDRTQNIVKYEALIRMRKIKDGKIELISPYFFLDTAIKTKQYETLTIIMIEKSFAIMKTLGKPFSLNLSFNDLINETVLQKLKLNIEKYDIGRQLTFEILESENIEDYQVIKNFIKEFKELGVKIAIDDFGSGFSNFTHVFELEPDILKIDGSLIKNIDKDKKSYEFVKSIVQLAHKLEIETLAEFVSSKEIFDITYELGVDYFQGYYFSPPVEQSKLKNKNILFTSS